MASKRAFSYRNFICYGRQKHPIQAVLASKTWHKSTFSKEKISKSSSNSHSWTSESPESFEDGVHSATFQRKSPDVWTPRDSSADNLGVRSPPTKNLAQKKCQSCEPTTLALDISFYSASPRSTNPCIFCTRVCTYWGNSFTGKRLFFL